MYILLTNDDGITGEGLLVLKDRLIRNHTVFILAPERDCSGMSGSVTIGKSLELHKYSEGIFSCSGTPSDCVITGIKSSLLLKKPDIVISGINRGANLGTDILYSGTASAARQSVLYGVPGVAVSLESFDGSWRYDALADYVNQNIEKLISSYIEGFFININAASASSYKGSRMTGLSKRDYNDTVEVKEKGENVFLAQVHGGTLLTEGDYTSDYETVRAGYISITQIQAEPASQNISIDRMAGL